MSVDTKPLVQECRLDLCIQCGTCSGGCPVKFRSPLNMRRLVRENCITSDASEILKRAELWACTTCSTCTLRCPAGVKNVEMIMGLRNILARQGDIPSTLRDALPIEPRVTGRVTLTTTDDEIGTIAVTGSFDVVRCF